MQDVYFNAQDHLTVPPLVFFFSVTDVLEYSWISMISVLKKFKERCLDVELHVSVHVEKENVHMHRSQMFWIEVHDIITLYLALLYMFILVYSDLILFYLSSNSILQQFIFKPRSVTMR